MTPYPGLEKWLNWLLNHSLQAGALVALVLAVQWLFRRRLTGRWRFALWWIVLARLLLPFNPPSAASLFNYFSPRVSLEGPRYPAMPVASASAPVAGKNEFSQTREIPPPVHEAGDGEISMAAAAPVTVVVPTANVSVRHPNLDFDDLLIPAAAGLWLAGVLALSFGVAIQTVRFRRRLARTSRPAGAMLNNLLQEARREAGVSRWIELMETGAVNSPALFGLWRLRLLLPRGLEEKFTPRELRYIFLHELAHVKRGDLWLNWLVTGLQIVHWFNPLIWFGFARLRADRELACDELALLCAGDAAGISYGETVIKLLENLHRPAAIPGLMGILEDKQQMRRRIAMIAQFRKPSRWSLLAALLLAAVATTALTDAKTEKASDAPPKTESRASETVAGIKPDLTGRVLDKNGAPLPVTATVFIATAGPKVGTSPFCPSCYADCQKSAQTDAAGNFEIQSLDPQLRFQILAVAKGFKPQYVNHVDPATGAVTVKLEPIELEAAPPENCLHGRVVDAKGEPIAGAVVEAHGIRTRNGGGRWGALPGVDPLAVTDENGEFLITSQKPFDLMDVKVSAHGFANKTFTELASGGGSHQLTLTEGAAARGRVLFHGQPLTNVLVGVVSVNRDMEHFTGNFDVGTDAAGRFLFVNLPPDVDYFIYGAMDSLKAQGAIPIQKFHSGKDGEVTDVGDLVVSPAHRLAGRVELADGAAIPAQTRLLVSREDAWDSRQIILPPDGRFDIGGVPTGTVTLSLRLTGYRVSAKNASLDTLNPFQLVGRVDGDITNLVFLLEKGDNLPPDYNSNMPEAEWPRNRPLRGAEGGADHARELAVSGRVTDSQTGEPLAHFRVTPGAADLTWKRNAWAAQKTVEGTNGHYLVYLDKKWSQPILKVAADGYLPALVLLRPLEQTNADLALPKGSGPRGTVLSPDGKPVAKADVLLICADSDQPGFDYAGHLTARWNKEQITTTDAGGHFSLAPQLGMRSVAVAAADGFAQVPMETLATNSTIVLQPFGTIQGVLHRPDGPGTNEDLDLAFVTDDSVSIYQRINLSHHAVTDAAGHFAFDRVPAGRLQISYRLKMAGQNGWQNVPLQQVTLNAGQNLEVDINAPARQTPGHYPGQRPPEPARVAGAKIEGVVLLPDGKPTAAQVAVQVAGKFLSLGKASFKSYDAWQDGSIVRAGSDGKFSLPMYVDAKSVVALNDDGYAQVSLADLKRHPQITLQPWGRIEGTVRLGRHFLTNALVVLSQPPRMPGSVRLGDGATNTLMLTNTASEHLEPPFYDFNDFQARTDEQGRFVIAYVPPGEQAVARLVPIGNGAQAHQPLGSVTVKPGEITKAQFGGGERTVTGKVTFASADLPEDLSRAQVVLHSGASFSLLQRLQQTKNPAERAALLQSAEYRQTMTSPPRQYSVKLAKDHSFKLEGVAPGDYELGVQLMDESEMLHLTAITLFTSPQKIVIPPAENANDDLPLEIGTIELKKLTVPTFSETPAAK